WSAVPWCPVEAVDRDKRSRLPPSVLPSPGGLGRAGPSGRLGGRWCTSAQNLGAVCRRDHRIKDEGGWRVDEPVAGVSVWTSPLGHTVIAGPPLVACPTVPPISRDVRLLPADGWRDPCGCLLRPCPHDQRASRAAGSNDLLGQSRRSYRLYDTDGKPFTERLCREYHAWQALYEDRPPF